MGLSGLITPSLTEMVNVATEMQRRGMNLPLLIGGATTSRQHTAVKIAPAYAQPVVHVIDASRVVGVVSNLLDPARKAKLDAENRVDQERLRAAPRGEGEDAAPALPQGAREPHARSSGGPRTSPPRRSSAPGRSSRPLAELRDYIDWTFFFTAWELKGRYPQILDHPQQGEAARELFEDGERAARPHRRRASSSRRAACTGSSRPRPRVTTSCSSDGAVFPCSANRRTTATTASPTGRSPTTSPRPRAGSPTTSAPSRSRPGSAPTSSPRPSRPTTTTTARSWSRRSPTASPRRSPSACTRRSGATGTRPTKTLPDDGAHPGAYRGHPAGVRLPGVPRPHREAHAVRPAGRARPRHGPHDESAR